MCEIRFKFVGAFNVWIDEARAFLAQGLEELAGVSAVLGAGALVFRIERAVAPIGSEVWPIPQRHQPEHMRTDSHLAGRPVPFQQMEFLEMFKNPEGEIDIDAERIKNLALKPVRQSFA